MSTPLVQIAIDVTSVGAARPLIHSARAAGADWIELGKPLIEFEGLNGVRQLMPELVGTYVLLDVMIVAAPEKYIRAAKDMGASNITVTALAPEETVAEAIAAGKRFGIDVTVDLFNTTDTLRKAQHFASLGADYLMVHFGVDQKRSQPQGSPIQLLSDVVGSVDVPVSYATYDIAESIAAVKAGARVIVQGEPLLSAPDTEAVLAEFISQTQSASKGA
ncbi:hypothetical protein KPL76_01615 [Subtercola sp. PAMC28395]|uniref:orotidine 5'-phosphate decarboxylase / HUMPS family protein n=1 Tax=Subtercola sp. PAMC28395 TaxID=2846775 RepID=UPI001C0CE8AD|nr:orotidine 5'-phosphate decarboxylase / HUMPS family protein [Subtercola sp. PAMC28395]QWT24159.1 hypothetical protein KPL76_01615 [Subtercola sp. PAMC28395]